jgi:hypothetical protein
MVREYLRIQLHDRQNVKCEPLELEVYGFTGRTLELLDMGATAGPWQKNSVTGNYETLVKLASDSLPLRALRLPATGPSAWYTFSLEAESSSGKLSSRGLKQPLGPVYVPAAQAGRFDSGEIAALYDDPFLGVFDSIWVPQEFALVGINVDVQKIPASDLRFYIQHYRMYFPGRWDPPLKIYVGRPNTASDECVKIEQVAKGSLDKAVLARIPHFQGKFIRINWALYIPLLVILLVIVVIISRRSTRRYQGP